MVQTAKEKTRFALLVDELGKMGSEELQKLNEVLVGILNQKRKIENIKLASSFRVGEKVRLKSRYQSRKPYDAAGTVKKVNQTKLVIEFTGEPGLWNVSPSMLDLIEDGSKN